MSDDQRRITEVEAFDALYLFLNKFLSDDDDGMLRTLAVSTDRPAYFDYKPSDPALWRAWTECITAVTEARNIRQRPVC